VSRTAKRKMTSTYQEEFSRGPRSVDTEEGQKGVLNGRSEIVGAMRTNWTPFLPPDSGLKMKSSFWVLIGALLDKDIKKAGIQGEIESSSESPVSRKEFYAEVRVTQSRIEKRKRGIAYNKDSLTEKGGDGPTRKGKEDFCENLQQREGAMCLVCRRSLLGRRTEDTEGHLAVSAKSTVRGCFSLC